MSSQKFQERTKMIEDCLALNQPSRVPNGIRVAAFPYYHYGLTIKEATSDFDKAADAFIRFHREFQPDIGTSIGTSYSFKAFDAMGIKNIRYAGDKKGLDENLTYQFIEYETLHKEEYDEYFNDPCSFAVTKWLPRIYEVFEPLANLPYESMVTDMYMESLNVFTSEPILNMCRRLLTAAEGLKEFRDATSKLGKTLAEMGFPSIMGGGTATAFDMLANGLRGTFGMMYDLIERPDDIERALEKFVKIHINNSKQMAKLTGNRYQWVMLHKGFDNFISDEMYARFYWPYLKEWALTLIDNDLTPVFFCEAKYNTRLKYLKELPPRKALFVFESTDLALAKKELGEIGCIMGGMPINLLYNGKKQEVVDKVKECMDIAAPGGGYIFSSSCSLDNVKPENVEAMFEAVELYGKY